MNYKMFSLFIYSTAVELSCISVFQLHLYHVYGDNGIAKLILISRVFSLNFFFYWMQIISHVCVHVCGSTWLPYVTFKVANELQKVLEKEMTTTTTQSQSQLKSTFVVDAISTFSLLKRISMVWVKSSRFTFKLDENA